MSIRALTAAVLFTFAGPVAAGESAATGFPIEGLEPTVAGIAGIFQAANDGRTSADLLLKLSPRPDLTDAQTAVLREAWEEQSRQLAGYSRTYERLEFIGVETVSSNALFLYLVADCEKAPMFVRAMVYRSRDRWYLHGMTWQPVFHEKSEELLRRSITRFDRPVIHPLVAGTDLASQPSVETR